MRKIVLVFFLFFISSTNSPYSAQPLDGLRRSIEKCTCILKDPTYEDTALRNRQRREMWEIIRNLFDFPELAKRTIGRNWTVFTTEQRREFTNVFAQFLGPMYPDKISTGLMQEKVILWDERYNADSKAFVRAKSLA